MSNLLGDLIKELKEKLFGKVIEPKPKKLPNKRSRIQFKETENTTRRPYFVQIGFDFGTAYSKCICRDVITNKAWVHVPSGQEGRELPFLIPSTLIIDDFSICKGSAHYQDNGLYHLKQALEKIALQEWNDPVIAPFRDWLDKLEGYRHDNGRLTKFVETCGVYFLAGAFGEVSKELKARLPGFGDLPDDYVAVNLAVPIADAQQPAVNNFYSEVLCLAWSLADTLPGHPSINLDELTNLIHVAKQEMSASIRDACFIYPEVSANVQGFVRSRASQPGIYLFSDTGAGTVDQAIFILNRNNNQDHLVYLHGSVLPLGSSLIELYAASEFGKTDAEQLEIWRERKERGFNDVCLLNARTTISSRLNIGTTSTLATSRRKLFLAQQINSIRVIFGGGGHSKNPYESAVIASFSGNQFANAINPPIVGIPNPQDLLLQDHQVRWLPRLSVAYGLSFIKEELARFTYPVNVAPPNPSPVWTVTNIPDAPTKDDC